MDATIRLQPATKSRLDAVKLNPQESDDETLNRVLDLADMAYDPEPLSEETEKRIEEGFTEIRAGYVHSLEEVRRDLGLGSTTPR